MENASGYRCDIQIQPELSAQASEGERLRLLLNAITDYAICMLDRNGYVSSWNAGAKRIKGYEAEEIVGEHFSRFYTEADRANGMPEAALRTAASEGRFESESWRVRKDGSRYWAHVIIDPIWGKGDEIVGYAKITRDLTERRRATEALRRSEQQFRLLVEGVTDYAIFMLDPNGRVSSWNTGAQRIKGYEPSEIIGEHFSRFYTPEDRAAGLPEASLQIARREGRFEREGWRMRKDGTRFMAHVVLDAIRDESGEVVGFAKVTRDITEKMRAQQSLERAQQALFQTQKMESIGQLTGGVAHDFNNLLTAIIGSLELLRKRLPREDPRAAALLQNALHGAERGATLTQRMLAFARRQDLRIEAIDLPELINGMLGLMERSIGPMIAIDRHMPPNLARVRCDANQLETALLNLVVNARDAMPNGGRITIFANEEQVDEQSPLGLRPGTYVCLSVSDTGQGMDRQTLLHATEPFFTTKGAGKGTGLGLSMVHGLVEQSGGRMHIESQLGVGTTAHIWLPAASGKPAAPRVSEPETVRPAPRRLVILVVDDDELVLTSTSAVLDDLGFKVIEASGGKRALQLIAENPAIDLMLTDQVMPGMTGLQLAHAVKELRPELPIILATGYAELPSSAPQNIRRLAKPFRLTELTEAIGAAVSTRVH